MGSGQRLSVVPALLAIGLSACVTATDVDEITNEAAQAVTLCGEWDNVDVNGKEYVIINNRWGASTTQCIEASSSSTRFEVTTSEHWKDTTGAPAAYPCIFKGCHWNDCTAGTNMPARASDIDTAPSSWSVSTPGSGAYNVAYDIWFHSGPNVSGQPDHAEVMIWINHDGGVQPAGSRVGSVSLAGAQWDVWYYTGFGWNYIAYVRQQKTTSVNLDLQGFFADASSRGYLSQSSYLVTIEAGFEIWQGAAGLTTNSFSASVNQGGTEPPPTEPPPTEPPPTEPPPTEPPPTEPPPTSTGDCADLQSWAGNDWRLSFSAGEVIEHLGDRYRANQNVSYPNADCAPDNPAGWCSGWFTYLGACGSSSGGGTTPDPTCNDGIQNQGEQAVDCGGPCPACPSCFDGIQNQGEQGIDCGGPCAACAPAPTCFDGIQNQGEQDIDCGGPCAACAPDATCNDGIQNQGEQDIDCGGPCAACSSGGSGSVSASVAVTNEWNEGYCADLVVRNDGGSAVSTWTVQLNTNQSSIYNSWNAIYTGGGPAYTVTPIGWNANLSPGGSVSVGFCANKQGSSWQPVVTSAE